MKKLIALSFVFVSVIITGCKPSAPPAADTHPASLVGKWKAEFTTKVRLNGLVERDASVTIGITTETNGSATFEDVEAIQNAKSPQSENITGTWKQTDDYWIIERPNGGFVAFRISTQTANQLTVFTRLGQTIQFNRIP